MAEPNRPLLTNAARPATFEVEAYNERGEMVPTSIAGEHPLTLYLDKREIVTLMTLGHAPEALAIGYLRNQRLVDGIDALAAVQVDWETDSVAVTTRNRVKGIARKLGKRTVTTGCGQGTVFGDLMDEIDRVKLPPGATLTRAALYDLLDRVRQHETIYKQAGAVHGCALAQNAPDRADKIVYTTGRLTSEMVIKCAQMGIPFLVSRSGLTQMGHDIARKVGMTMIGRATNKHFLLFTGAERFAG